MRAKFPSLHLEMLISYHSIALRIRGNIQKLFVPTQGGGMGIHTGLINHLGKAAWICNRYGIAAFSLCQTSVQKFILF